MSNIVTEPETGKQHLQEIALAEGGVSRSLESEREKRHERYLNDLEITEADDNEEHKLKTGSLRRFFRKNPKKSSESSVADMGVDRKPYAQEQNPTGDDGMDDEAGVSDTNQESYKRFKFRLGGMYRYSNSHEIDSKMDLNDSASKVTLKSSLSSYWNAVFKKKKSKSAHEVGQHEDMGIMAAANNFSESALQSPQRGNALAEDIHALKISEDPNAN